MFLRHITRNPKDAQEILIRAYDEYADALFRYCFFRIHNRERAKELVQETFTRTWEHIRSGNAIENLRAFLYKVMRNLIIDESRKNISVSLDALREEGFEPSRGMREQEEIDAAVDLKQALLLMEKLGEKYKEVLMLRYIEGFTPKEIAELLDENENAVYVRLHRGLKELRNLIKNG